MTALSASTIRSMPRTRARAGEEDRSHFVVLDVDASVPSSTDPCTAPAGVHWIWARSPGQPQELDLVLVGKWLIYVACGHVGYCWHRVREATEERTLGIGAKVSTDWGKAQDLAGIVAEGAAGWRDHVICVYTADWRNREDVARVGSRLAEIDAVRTQTLHYKPDALTYGGMWAGNAPGEIAIYSMRKPYQELLEDPETVAAVRELVQPGACRQPTAPS